VKRRAPAITNAAEDELLLADVALQHFFVAAAPAAA
jgi:hypothetical protein